MEKKKTNYPLNKKRYHVTMPPSLPATGAQLTIVTDNAEGKEHMKIKFQWQQDRNK